MITQVERTFEGVLITFRAANGDFTVFYSDPGEAVRFASTVMAVATLGTPADPSELLPQIQARWSVTYRCGCTDHRPSNDAFRELCPEHGAEQKAPPRLEAAA